MFFWPFFFCVFVFLIDIISLLPSCRMLEFKIILCPEKSALFNPDWRALGNITLSNIFLKCHVAKLTIHFETCPCPFSGYNFKYFDTSRLYAIQFLFHESFCPTNRIPWDYLYLLRNLHKVSEDHALGLVLTCRLSVLSL